MSEKPTSLDAVFKDWREAIRFVHMYLAVHESTGIGGKTCGKLERILLDAIYDCDELSTPERSASYPVGMTDKSQHPPPSIAEGLIEFLQETAPRWSTKLTMERLTFTGLLANAQRENELLRATLAKYHEAPLGGPDLRSCDLIEKCRRIAVRRMTGWTTEDCARSQDFRYGIEKAASDIAQAISNIKP